MIGVDLQGRCVGPERLIGAAGALECEREIGAWVGMAGEQFSGPHEASRSLPLSRKNLTFLTQNPPIPVTFPPFISPLSPKSQRPDRDTPIPIRQAHRPAGINASAATRR